MTETLFQRIIRGDISADVVLETDRIVAIRDIRPQAPVHILVITKYPYPSFEDLPADEFGEIQAVIIRIAENLGIREAGYRVVTNVGEDGGQSVPHLHFHVLGGHRLSRRIG